ncbi:efflux RND transporter periplasmic adaptor subunit [Halovulum sp. GXIMD14794]
MRMLVLGMVFAAATAGAQDTPPPKVVVAAAYTEEITEEATFVGRGEAKDRIELVARVNGYLDEALITDGAAVSAGELLFVIEPESYEATLESRRADLARAEANLDLATIELERKSELVAREAIPQSEQDVAQANKLAAEADVRAAQAAVRQAELELSYTEVRAPFDGRLGRIGVSVGDVVGPGNAPLATLVREAPIFVSFSLSEKELLDVRLAYGEPSAAELPDHGPDVFVGLPNGVDLEEAGRLVFVENRINPLTGAIAVRAEFENARRLILDGAFVNVRIQAINPVERTMIPLAAVQRDQRGEFVLVVGTQQTVEQRYVTTGRTYGTAVVVSEGLQPGESVIVEGLQRVRPGVTVDAVIAGTGGN